MRKHDLGKLARMKRRTFHNAGIGRIIINATVNTVNKMLMRQDISHNLG
jgi:hypothetical protein